MRQLLFRSTRFAFPAPWAIGLAIAFASNEGRNNFPVLGLTKTERRSQIPMRGVVTGTDGEIDRERQETCRTLSKRAGDLLERDT